MRSVLPSLMALAMIAVPTACSDVSAPSSRGGEVTVKFSVASAGTLSAIPLGPNAASAVAAQLPLSGDNGTLSIDEIWLVVGEFELMAAQDTCQTAASQEDHGDEMEDGGGDRVDGMSSDDHDGEGCGELELPPFFVSLPLEGESAGTVSADVPAGTYSGVKLETRAPHEGDSLLTDIRANQFADWPAGASMLVVGSFTPTDGDPVSFRAYFRAEVEVQRTFSEPLVVGDGDTQSVTVVIDPSAWFVRDDGTVLDLSAFDYDATQQVFEFEGEMEHGFGEVDCGDR